MRVACKLVAGSLVAAIALPTTALAQDRRILTPEALTRTVTRYVEQTDRAMRRDSLGRTEGESWTAKAARRVANQAPPQSPPAGRSSGSKVAMFSAILGAGFGVVAMLWIASSNPDSNPD
jgi:hypothetical protein